MEEIKQQKGDESCIDISVVIPLYRCSESLNELWERLTAVLKKLGVSYEILFVNDRSPADDWSVVQELVSRDSLVRGISLSRNFGQHAAIFAGLSKSRGQWVVVMDGDLQDVPEEIEKLYAKALEGWNYVQGSRENRQDGFFKKLASRWFYKILGYFTDTEQDPCVANYGIYSEKVVSAMLSMQDKVKFLPAMVSWVGFSGCKIEVEHSRRELGTSSYSINRMLKLAFAVIVGFSDKPLRLVVRLGATITLMSLLYAGYTVVRWLNGDILVMGYSSIIVSIWLLFGINMIILGMMGIYLGRVYEHTKNRPYFIIDEEL